MASGGGLGESYSNVSDEYHDFSCYSCAREHRNVAAVKFCVDCNHLLCATCLGHHNKFDIMKGHQILDKTASCGVRGTDKPDIPTLRCAKHDGKIIDMFCKTHDEPCCVVCASLDHSACTDKNYLPDVAKVDFRPEEFQTLKPYADKIKLRLEKARKNRADNLESISDQMTAILLKISEKREAINKKLDALENGIKSKLDKKFIVYSSELTEEIEILNDYVSRIDENQETFVSAPENKSDAFIIMKQLKHHFKNESHLVAGLSKANRNIKLIETCSMSKILKAIDTFEFGRISGNGEIESVVEDAEYNIKDADDTTVSCISDSCLMGNGSIILADENNRKLKKLDHLVKLKESLTLPGKPCAICPTGTSEIAVSLLNNKTIQFVSTTNSMTITRAFKVGESCRGLAYSYDKLYLSCGGMTKFHDGPGEIRIYEKSGKLIHKVEKNVLIPKRISISSDKMPVNIYVADEKNGLLSLDTSKPCVVAKNIFTHKDMVSPVGLCYTGIGQIVVCGYDSSNVMLLSTSGTLIKELLNKGHGIVKPKTVCLDQTGSKLLVGMSDTDQIKVVHLIRK
ncbi:uncharacterized protein LOC123527628 [Mercenaria mercenaria]|uniref:uncharacterized protein LOC123527628 n=1 Tax=Mercenaria mercenaria TaxID=6596 RepID=UPI00234FB275|nr:uncharacterized protein LOC123527628 [Mercenaria mercenaria]